jgi:hypothetical protein
MDNDSPNTVRRPLRGLLIAAVIALVLLFTIVLPAQRGYDPTGVGRLLGLTAMSGNAGSGGAGAPALDDVIGGNDALAPTGESDGGFGDPIPLPNPAIHQAEAGAPVTETFTINLGFDEKTEIKAVMKKSKVLLYEWSVEGGEVYVDFHGHDPEQGDDFWVRYEERDGVNSGAGSLVAPFDGEHGWFWLNASQGPVTIHLKVTGYQERMADYGLLR